MNIQEYDQVLQFLNSEMEFQQIRLIDGELLHGKHVLLHAFGEAALYQINDVAEVRPLLITSLNRDYADISLIWVEKSQTGLDKISFNGSDCEKILRDKKTGFIFFPVIEQKATMIDFQELVAHLRAPEGCPWDREQTHQSLKSNLLEETYEALDAIDSAIPVDLQEELGDVLLQVVLHAQIASETSEFTLADVIDAIHKKITFRHPHVFKNLEVEGVKGVIHNWEILKSQERENNHSSKESILDSIPRDLPALSLAQKYQERAARVGFDWPEIEPVLDKVIEEIDEFRKAEDKSTREAELGDLLFALVNVVRWSGLDAEGALRKMTRRFYTRFKSIEKKASSEGRKISDMSLEEMDALWEHAKDDESKAARTGQ